MKRILITQYFKKSLKKLKNHFDEQDVLEDIQGFVNTGLRKGESRLTIEEFGNITVEIVKLRIRVHNSKGRYLLGIIDQCEYIPIFIDLKTGYYGQNMTLSADKKVASMLESAIEGVLKDYLEHTDNNPRVTAYLIE